MHSPLPADSCKCVQRPTVLSYFPEAPRRGGRGGAPRLTVLGGRGGGFRSGEGEEQEEEEEEDRGRDLSGIGGGPGGRGAAEGTDRGGGRFFFGRPVVRMKLL